MRARTAQSTLLIAGLTAAIAAGADPTSAAARTSALERVSVSSAEKEAEGSASRFLAMSANGRFVAFDSPAKSLVKGDTNGDQVVFARDRRSLDLR